MSQSTTFNLTCPCGRVFEADLLDGPTPHCPACDRVPTSYNYRTGEVDTWMEGWKHDEACQAIQDQLDDDSAFGDW